MKYRKLGKTGLSVSEIGMGTWQLAGKGGMWAGSDEKESLKALAKFVDMGGNFIDTAWVYGYEHEPGRPVRHASEELIGKFIRESNNRDKVVIASKIPPLDNHWPARSGVAISQVFPGEHIINRVEDSLRSLGVETIDLMQFHVWQDYFVEQDEWKKTIQEITNAGKVRFWGISINDYQPSNCLRTLETGLISSVQTIFNIFHQKPVERLFPSAVKNNVGIIARVPLDEGGLTDKFTKDLVLPQGDFRSEYFSPERLIELRKRIKSLTNLANGEAKTLAELAIRFILSFDEVSTVITGLRKVEHVDENLSISDGRKLSQRLLSKLRAQSWERNFYPFGKDPALKENGYIEV